jgi:two-component system sensor histidine kinase TorS
MVGLVCQFIDVDFAEVACNADHIVESTERFSRQSGCQDDAAHAGEAEQIRRTAHQLRSAASNLGLQRVMQACRRLEDAAREGMLTAAQRVLLISQLLESIPEGIEALEHWLGSPDEGPQDAALSASR